MSSLPYHLRRGQPGRNHPPPIDASEMAAILAEAEAADQRAISEVEEAAPLAVTPCAHHDFIPRVHRGEPWDDHVTQYGWCPGCSSWLAVTDYLTGRTEARVLTLLEIDRFAGYEDKLRAQEWLAERAEGRH